jgi:hypothetical protein
MHEVSDTYVIDLSQLRTKCKSCEWNKAMHLFRLVPRAFVFPRSVVSVFEFLYTSPWLFILFSAKG